MRTRVKICGITRLRDARAAVAAGADALGFVFWPRSPRRIGSSEARAIVRQQPAGVTCVGVFVDAGPDEVARVVRAVGLTAVQLHGDEDIADYWTCGAPLIKVVTLAGPEDVRRAAALPAEVTVLVDARDLVRRGGTGALADWRLARRLARRRPIWLAGGLSPANVGRALVDVRPWGIDVSSGVEVAPGRKSPPRMAALFAAVARGDRTRHDG